MPLLPRIALSVFFLGFAFAFISADTVTTQNQDLPRYEAGINLFGMGPMTPVTTGTVAGVYIKLLPGIIHFQPGGDLPQAGLNSLDHFAFDFGGGVVHHSNFHTYFRYDIGSQFIFYGNSQIFNVATATRERLGTRSNMVIGVGLGIHF